jgi:hypothetical protein
MKNRKLILGIFLVIIVVLIFAGGAYYVLENKIVPIDDDVSEDNSVENYGVVEITTYDEFLSLINRDKNTFLVLGKTGCHYPVLTKIAEEYKIEIVYVNIAKLTAEDKKSVFNSTLTIPAKCTDSEVDVSLNSGFGTPLSLFVNSGTTYDCIRGYKNESDLKASLIEIGYID